MIRETTAPQDVTWLKIDEVYPYECNNKIHKQPEITKIANSIKEFGWTYPILIDENNIVLAGHKRLLAAKQIGLTEVPTIRKDDLSDAQKRAYRIIDNKSSEESEYDPTNLALELDEIKALDFDISKFINLNFDLDKIGETQDLDAQEDDYDAEPPAEPKTKYGDIYQLGNHRLMCGDSTKEEDVAKLMNGQLADMVFTDPPYSMSNNFDTLTINLKKLKKRVDDIVDFNPETISYLTKLNICSFYIFTSKNLIPKYFEIFKNFDFNILVWCKDDPTPLINYTFLPDIEYLLYFSKKGRVWNNGLDTNVYRKYYNGKKLEGRREAGDIHPTIKPQKIIQDKILISSSINGNVLDLFGGSGSTLIACEQLNRNCYMMELDERYVQVIIDRWEKFTGQKAQKIEE